MGLLEFFRSRRRTVSAADPLAEYVVAERTVRERLDLLGLSTAMRQALLQLLAQWMHAVELDALDEPALARVATAFESAVRQGLLTSWSIAQVAAFATASYALSARAQVRWRVSRLRAIAPASRKRFAALCRAHQRGLLRTPLSVEPQTLAALLALMPAPVTADGAVLVHFLRTPTVHWVQGLRVDCATLASSEAREHALRKARVRVYALRTICPEVLDRSQWLRRRVRLLDPCAEPGQRRAVEAFELDIARAHPLLMHALDCGALQAHLFDALSLCGQAHWLVLNCLGQTVHVPAFPALVARALQAAFDQMRADTLRNPSFGLLYLARLTDTAQAVFVPAHLLKACTHPMARELHAAGILLSPVEACDWLERVHPELGLVPGLLIAPEPLTSHTMREAAARTLEELALQARLARLKTAHAERARLLREARSLREPVIDARTQALFAPMLTEVELEKLQEQPLIDFITEHVLLARRLLGHAAQDHEQQQWAQLRARLLPHDRRTTA